MKSPALVFWLLLAVVGSVAYGSWVAWRNLRESEQRTTASTHTSSNSRRTPSDGPPIKEFQLTERSGRQFDSKELQGQVWIASVFFANCPGSCWQMNQSLKGLYDEFRDTDLLLVSITCDPENDTPQALEKYADRLNADRGRWLFLTGDWDYIQRIGRDVLFQDIQKGAHTFRALLIDRQGKIRGSFDMLDQKKVAELKELTRQLLAEKPTQTSEADAMDHHAEAAAANASK